MGNQVAEFAVGDRVLEQRQTRFAPHREAAQPDRTGAPQTLLRVPDGVCTRLTRRSQPWGQWRCTAFAKRSQNWGRLLPWWGKEWWDNSSASFCD